MERVDTKSSEVVSFEDDAAAPPVEAQETERPRRRRRNEPPPVEVEKDEEPEENPFSEGADDGPDDYLQDRNVPKPMDDVKPVNSGLTGLSGLTDEEGVEIPAAEEPKEPKETKPQKMDNKVVLEIRQPGQRGRPPRSDEPEPERMSSSEFDELVDKLDLSGKGSSYIQVHRFEPRTYKGQKISGYLAKFSERIDYDMLASMYGGGIYDVYFFDEKERNGKKKTILLAKRRLEVSGKPILQGEQDDRHHEPDIVDRTIAQSEKMMDRMAREKEHKEKKAEEYQNMLLQQALTKKDDGKETFAFMKDLLEHQKEVANRQAEQAREEAKIAREELINSRKEFKEEMRAMKEELENKATREVNPLIEFMRANARESTDKFGEIMKEMATRNENTVKMLTEMARMQQENQREMAKMQQESQKSTYETQIKVMEESNKMKDDILLKRLNDVTEELKEARRAGSSDLVSKLKEFNVIKGLFQSGAEQEKETITDKIFNNLDMFPQIIQSVGSLISKGTPVVMNPGQMLPPGQPQMGGGVPGATVPMPTEQEVPQNPPPGMRDNMALELAIGKLKQEAEAAIDEDVTPEEFFEKNIVGKYDPEILKKIAAVPAKAVISVLEQSITGANEDSVLITADGRNWLTKLHAVLVSKYGT